MTKEEYEEFKKFKKEIISLYINNRIKDKENIIKFCWTEDEEKNPNLQKELRLFIFNNWDCRILVKNWGLIVELR